MFLIKVFNKVTFHVNFKCMTMILDMMIGALIAYVLLTANEINTDRNK
jgi:hypothetical protein